ncbi:hypothetical protein ZL58_23735 [Salmonella enterica subsp. enterica serovar Typhimurium]|nr:hypothetical protein [Salmonella enterica subsp. enterica serovar Typhimurium]
MLTIGIRDKKHVTLWGKDISSNAIQVYISSLRKKLGRDDIITFLAKHTY